MAASNINSNQVISPAKNSTEAFKSTYFTKTYEFFQKDYTYGEVSDAVAHYFGPCLLYSEFIYTFADLRSIIKKHMVDKDTKNPNAKWYKCLTTKNVKLVNFESVDLVYTQPMDKSAFEEDDDLGIYLRHPITPQMLGTFISDNRKKLKKNKKGKIVVRYDENKEDGMDRLMFLFGIAEKVDLSIVEFDDRFKNSELVYAMVVNKKRKSINLVFRGSATKQDWKQDFMVSYIDASDLKRNQKNMFKSKYIANDELSSNGEVKFQTGFVDYLFGETPDENYLSKFDKIVENLEKRLTEYKGYEVVITGHSLGGALTQLLAFALASSQHCREFLPLPIRAISFASPPVGNLGYQQKFKELEDAKILRHVRFTNQGDIIPVVPFPREGCQTGLNLHVFRTKELEIGGFSNTKTFLSQARGNFTKHHSLEEYWNRTLNGSNEKLLGTSIDYLYQNLEHEA